MRGSKSYLVMRDQGGSLLAFAPGNVAPRIRSITGRHSLFPPSYTRILMDLPCGRLCPVFWAGIRAYRVPHK
ncbi:protein of unknown function [Acidithiobacillus ferrivorans]|uniref:Uncharacterized protein n=1 Tax=Acidithiobacillus ferrivorans TaxID=160808 RepID=A0ABY1MNH0_9PROT|nr:protein of unknown function [Acidithiobacillus ferrivorans]SMH65334.1 protein of unknown function [Acidithiobacillus ferrivorans]SMH67672.1 protein of unknown function [Acidithiobacillus ferrivorans]